jgi:hypothetical protein
LTICYFVDVKKKKKKVGGAPHVALRLLGIKGGADTQSTPDSMNIDDFVGRIL